MPGRRREAARAPACRRFGEHHRLIDDQPEVYPVARLVANRSDHERWVADVLDAARDADAARRPDGLARLRAESIARCIERWQALGIPLALARELAADPAVGARPELADDGRPLVVVVGDVGSGKSLAGERLHSGPLDDDTTRSRKNTYLETVSQIRCTRRGEESAR